MSQKWIRRLLASGAVVAACLAPAATVAWSQSGATTVSPEEVQPSSTAAQEPFKLRIGPGDLVAVEVFGLPAFDREVRVAPDGTITMPLLDSISVGGLTPVEVASKVEGILSERQLANNPEVSITVKDLVSQGVWVQGAVNQPGVYQLFGPRTVLEMLLEAGGLSGGQTAGQRIVVIGRTADGQRTRTEIDARKLLDEGDLELNLALRPGDIILVPTLQKLRVYVSGAVKSPGPVEYLSSEGITLLQAITAAGGPTERARLSKVQVIRRGEDGSEERLEIDVTKIRKGKREDFPLNWNDTIVVRERFL